MAFHRFDAADIAPMPWKNGGGATRELLSWPPGAGFDGFDWRVSLATIAQGGPFSAFPGIDRTILLLDGPGVRLRSADGAVDHALDRPWRPFDFAGEAEVSATLLGGPSVDFNLMVRRSRLRGEFVRVDAASAFDAAPHGLLFVLAGHWQLDLDGAAAVCAPHQGVWWAGEPHRASVVPQGDGAALLAIRLAPVTSP